MKGFQAAALCAAVVLCGSGQAQVASGGSGAGPVASPQEGAASTGSASAAVAPPVTSPNNEATPPAAQAPVAQPKSSLPADNITPPPPGQGQVIFFRRGGFVGSAISCAVHENGSKLTSLPPGRFAAVNVAAGVHSFAVKSEATDVMRIDVEPGKLYYAQCTVKMGLMVGEPNLTPTDKAAFFALGTKLKPVS